ncbi:MAG: hypothetical protein M0P76_07100 [Candidatus Pacebacteria bacterium]|jgi:hypothetical protein|nr:hypothetical protein [Candidatus Paceibacterota bacterium]
MGKKKITIRKYREGVHDFNKDEVFVGIFKDGLNILLVATTDGFTDADDAFLGLKRYYPELKRTDNAAVIRYRVYSVDDVPSVSANLYFK